MASERDKRAWTDEEIRRGYTDEDLAEVSQDEELTPEQLAQAKPFAEAFPELHASWQRKRGPQKAPTKVSVGIRLSPDVVAHYRASGRGWQTRVDEILREAAGLPADRASARRR